MNAIVFSTDDFPFRDRLASYRDEFRRLVSLDILPASVDRPFRAKSTLMQAGLLGVGKLWTSPADYARTARALSDGADAFVLSLCRHGEGISSIGDHTIGARQAVFCDNARAQSIRCTKDSAWWTIKIPRSRLTACGANTDRLAGGKLDERNQMLRLLFSYLEAIDPLEIANEKTAATLGNHIFDLVALAIGAQNEVQRSGEQLGLREARRASIMGMIDANFACPDFTASRVAREMGISARYVHLLMEETGETFAERVLSRRLEAALAELLKTGGRKIRIADIAHDVGFTDLSHFNRSFRRHFGDTPSGVRNSRNR